MSIYEFIRPFSLVFLDFDFSFVFSSKVEELEMVNQSLRNRDKVKDDAIVCSMHVIKWWCYNEGSV